MNYNLNILFISLYFNNLIHKIEFNIYFFICKIRNFYDIF